ncbi:hypothetical protein [Terricaulis sp.]|uniref:hypothetical protein n=1 Tax=Terricaulis sp. TaxID=2768686 RepID=UPI003784D85A
MASFTRRSALVGGLAAAAAAPTGAGADIPTDLRQHPGYRAWTAPSGATRLPLQARVQTSTGEMSLSELIGRRPAVVALWATWCAPCLLEKPPQASLSRRLARAGAATRVFALQAFDDFDVSFDDGCWMLNEMGAGGLPAARATPAAETAFRDVFGTSRDPRVRAVLPAVLLIGGDGLELGRSVGMMRGAEGRGDYWREETTFDFLSRLM